MFVMALQSGSNGNCIYVESAKTRLLLDAGISGAQAAARLALAGRDIRDVHGVLISHDHVDHARCAGVFHRKFGLPLYATQRTIEAAAERHALGEMTDIRCFQPGHSVRIGDITVETVPTPHDAVEGVAFVLDDGRRRLGVLTDLGHAFDGLADVLDTLDAVLLESNYDPLMLESGPYPWHLQERIRGPAGHLSNLEAAELVRDAVRAGRLRWACLGHLSEHNNTPDLALATCRRVIGPGFTLRLASRYEPTGLMEV